MLLWLLVSAVAAKIVVLSRYDHRGDGVSHRDEIRCHRATEGHHGSFPALIEEFVLAGAIWCIDPRPGSTCTDITSRSTYKLIEFHCAIDDRECVASIDCYDLVFERFWVCLVVMLLSIIALVMAICLALDRSNARNVRRNKQI